MIEFLIWMGCLLVIIGIFCTIWSFRSPKMTNVLKLLRLGEIGVIFALIGGLIIIRYYYAKLPLSQRILDEHLEEKYKEEDPDISAYSR